MFKNRTNAGIAYVALSRSEQLNDIYIKGTLERDGIHASPDALEETNRLQTIFDQNAIKVNERAEKYWQISYLNVRSLNCHKDDVAKDNFLMSAGRQNSLRWFHWELCKSWERKGCFYLLQHRKYYGQLYCFRKVLCYSAQICKI